MYMHYCVQVVSKGSILNGKPLIMKWYSPPTCTSLPSVKALKLASIPVTSVDKLASLNMRRVVVESPTGDDNHVSS